jgi:hypothetical protein
MEPHVGIETAPFHYENKRDSLRPQSPGKVTSGKASPRRCVGRDRVALASARGRGPGLEGGPLAQFWLARRAGLAALPGQGAGKAL